MTYKIALVGEAYGEEEEKYARPFIGRAGDQLNSLLADAGILREECYITNTFNLRPVGNDLSTLCCGLRDGDAAPGLSALVRGKYLKREYVGEISRLHRELEEIRPNLTVLLGNTACWAVLNSQAISKIRGTCCTSPLLPGLKFLPTYHPAAVLRQFELRHVTVLDLLKAKRESEFPELRRPRREIWMDPSLEDIERFYHEFVLTSPRMAFDIETAFGQITCIGFAPSIDRALVIPFLDYRCTGGHYWKTLEEELEAWKWVERMLASSSEKVGQNTLYDIQYLWRMYGITVSNYTQDTMLLHHSLQPESPKSLAFLGSVYCNEVSWKSNRPKSRHTEKPADQE